MNKQRSRQVKFNAPAKIKGKALIVAVVALVIGVSSVAIGAGIYWAIGVASVSAVLLIQLATSWQQARTQTERFQQLRNRIEKLGREVAAISASATVRDRSPENSKTAPSVTPPAPSNVPSSRQMFDIQRELDYLLWRVSSARPDNEMEHMRNASGPTPTDLLNGTSGR